MGVTKECSVRRRWNSSDVVRRASMLHRMGMKPKTVDYINLQKDFDDLPEPWKCFMLEHSPKPSHSDE